MNEALYSFKILYKLLQVATSVFFINQFDALVLTHGTEVGTVLLKKY